MFHHNIFLLAAVSFVDQGRKFELIKRTRFCFVFLIFHLVVAAHLWCCGVILPRGLTNRIENIRGVNRVIDVIKTYRNLEETREKKQKKKKQNKKENDDNESFRFSI